MRLFDHRIGTFVSRSRSLVLQSFRFFYSKCSDILPSERLVDPFWVTVEVFLEPNDLLKPAQTNACLAVAQESDKCHCASGWKSILIGVILVTLASLSHINNYVALTIDHCWGISMQIPLLFFLHHFVQYSVYIVLQGALHCMPCAPGAS